jgi:hypothetical protein
VTKILRLPERPQATPPATADDTLRRWTIARHQIALEQRLDKLLELLQRLVAALEGGRAA